MDYIAVSTAIYSIPVQSSRKLFKQSAADRSSHNSVNDFIDSELCAVRYANIDDAVKLVKRIGRNGKLAKADVKKCISFTSSFSERF
jgi:ABC-type thiamine transport system substrate-binding protein